MLPWILLSVLSICHAYKTNVVCYGHDALFPDDVSVSMYLHKVFFTPSSPPGLITMVMDESTSLDPRFKRRSFSTKLQDVTMDDEGIYSVLFPENDKPLPVLGITVKDCSVEAWLKYGMSYSFEVSRAVSLIDYSPLNDDKVIVMWDRTHPVNTARGTLENGNFVMDNLTQTDQGVYTLRGRRGKFFHRFRIYIEEWKLSKAVQAGEVFEFSFPLDPSEVSLAFKPSFRDDAASSFTLMEGGVLVNRWLFKERIHYVGGLTKELQITDLMPEDQGTFWVRDRHGNLAKVVELTVVSQHIPVTDTGFKVNYPVLLASVAVSVLATCFAKCCCCRKSSTKSESDASTPEELVVFHHETTNIGPRPTEPYTGIQHNPPYNPDHPSISTSNQQPQDADVLTHPFNVVAGDEPPSYEVASYFQGIDSGGVAAPSLSLGFDCLSSDSGIQFEFPRGVGYPLTSDPPSYADIYTSDKLNFS
ncbi:uncharacterized protein LOC134024226 [Osmerus eperlanus]|uniref:uncharacterized protein LOC134024226 n=1 Tax=Osmerus eperlanus TaxID=29151 RepID=UPI002E111C73